MLELCYFICRSVSIVWCSVV